MTKSRPPSSSTSSSSSSSAPPTREPKVAPRSSGAPIRTPEEERQALLQILQKMGFSLTRSEAHGAAGEAEADLWVRPPGTKSLVAPVFVEASSPGSPEARAERLVSRWTHGLRTTAPRIPRASILIVTSDQSAEIAGQRLVATSPVPLPETVSRTRILVNPSREAEPEASPHWHRLRLPPRVVLMLATGTLLALAERAEKAQTAGDEGGGGVIDVEGMFRELRRTFNVDVEGSLGVTREEDAMFLLYQLALRETYAPGDQGASLHELVNDPKGPAARLPWFAI